MAERKPRFVVDDKKSLIIDTESLAFPDEGEVVAAAIDPAWARVIGDALNRSAQ